MQRQQASALGWRALGLGDGVSGLETILNIHDKPGGDMKTVGWRRVGFPNPTTYPDSLCHLRQVSDLWCPPSPPPVPPPQRRGRM